MQTDKWEFYQDAANEWRWRLVAPNGEIIGASTEGYKNVANCRANAARLGWQDEGFVIVEAKSEVDGTEVFSYTYNEGTVPRKSLTRLSDDELKEPLWWLNLFGKLNTTKVFRDEPYY